MNRTPALAIILMTLMSSLASAHEAAKSRIGEIAQATQATHCERHMAKSDHNQTPSRWNGKTVILDTNVLLNKPLAFRDFPGAHVIIPGAVMAEINEKKSDANLGFAARRFSNELVTLMQALGTASDIPLEDSARLTVDINNRAKVLADTTLDPKEKDNQIIAAAKHYANGIGRENVILVSDDTNMQILAIAAGLQTSGLIFDWVTPASDREVAIHSLKISDEEMQKFLSDGSIALPENSGIAPNEFVTLSSPSVEASESTVGRFRFRRDKPEDQRIQKIPNFAKMGLPAVPRNLEQAMWLDLALDPTVDCVIVEGLAGSGKTFFSMLAALQLMKAKDTQLKRVMVARPTVYFGDRSPGALPGDQQEKDRPWLAPFIQNLDKIKKLEVKARGGKPGTNESKDLPDGFEWQPYEYFRGITFDNVLAILDEIQNASPEQVLTILTRVGDGSRMFLMGDSQQVDGSKRYLNSTNNGLAVAMSTLLNPQLSLADRSRVGFVKLVKAERSEFADMVSRARDLQTQTDQ